MSEYLTGTSGRLTQIVIAVIGTIFSFAAIVSFGTSQTVEGYVYLLSGMLCWGAILYIEFGDIPLWKIKHNYHRVIFRCFQDFCHLKYYFSYAFAVTNGLFTLRTGEVKLV
jgi:ABC-type uncharacterized transport system fused permease/ATPase subunit